VEFHDPATSVEQQLPLPKARAASMTRLGRMNAMENDVTLEMLTQSTCGVSERLYHGWKVLGALSAGK